MKPRLLFLSHVLPHPPDSGVTIRTYNTLRVLSRHFDVTALCFYRTSHLRDAAAVDASLRALGELVEVEAFPIPAESSRVRLLWDHARSLVTRRPYTFYLHRSSAYRSRLRALLATDRFDLVHVESLDLCGYLPSLSSRPVVCVHHNVESALLERRARAEPGRLRRAYIAAQARRVEAAERRWCGRVALNVAVSEDDRRQLVRRAPHGRYAVVPNGVDVEHFGAAPHDHGRDLVFVGGATWFPNRDALTYFCDDILPLIRRSDDTVRVRWVGSASPGDRERFATSYGVDLTGYVPDERPHIREAAAFIVPLRVGGGTRLKILIAWAMGKAVVSTSVGCEGLAAVHGENILIADSPAEFARAVEATLRDGELRRRLGQAGRRTAERLYSWEVVGEEMVRRYDDVIHARYASAAPV